MGPLVISDLKYQIVLIPMLDPPMTKKMERKFREIARHELYDINTTLTSSTLKAGYHVLNLSAPPDISPITIAKVIMETVSRRLIDQFKDLSGWGDIYHDSIFIKSGSRLDKDKIAEFIDLSLGGV
jgi:hypothetical protein